MKKDSPTLYEDLTIVWEAFVALSLSRKGTEAIRFSEIEAWLNINAISDLDYRQEIAHLIRFLDSKYLELIGSRNAYP